MGSLLVPGNPTVKDSLPGTPQLKIALMLKWFKQNLLALSREIFIDKAAARD